MSSNKVETAEGVFELSDYDYDFLRNVLKRLTHTFAPKDDQPKPPTVEISLEDAKNVLYILKTYQPLSIENGAGKNFKEAISKAEGKDIPVTCPAEIEKDEINLKMTLNSFHDRISHLEDRLSPTTAKAQTQVPVNVPELTIQDQVNKLFELLNKLQDHLFKCQERESNMMDYSERLFERISKLEDRMKPTVGLKQ